MTTTIRIRDSDNATGRFGEVMKLLSLHGIKQRFISCSDSRIATVLTELSYTHTQTHTHTHGLYWGPQNVHFRAQNIDCYLFPIYLRRY